jgi:hypothetical protein
MAEEWMAYLPNGTPMPATKSASAQSAMAKAMMMDVPAGCSVKPSRDVEQEAGAEK